MQETEISGLKGTQHHYVNTLPLSLFYQQHFDDVLSIWQSFTKYISEDTC